MRVFTLAAVPALAALVAMPAVGQVSARVHLDIPIGRPAVAYAAPRREVVVREYDPNLYGNWDQYYDDWAPETVYLYDGRYYDYPVVDYAQPIVVYRYNNSLFFAPRDRGFITWRENRDFRGNGRTARPYYAAPRQPRYEAPRGQFRGQDSYQGGRAYESVPRGGAVSGDRGARPAPQNDRSGRVYDGGAGSGRDQRGGQSAQGHSQPAQHGRSRGRP